MNDSNYEKVYYREYLAPKYWLTWLLIGLIHFLAYLPYSAQRALSRGLAALCFAALKSRRHTTLTNVQKCFPDYSPAQQQALARETFYSFCLGLFETATAWCRGAKPFKPYSTFVGLENLDLAAEKGGILVVGGHYALMDLSGVLYGMSKHYNVVHRNHDNPLLDLFITRVRLSSADSVLGRKDIKQWIRKMKKGETVAYYPDQDFGPRDSVFAPFFDIPTATITATSRIAKLSKASVIPVFVFRDKSRRHYTIEIGSPLSIPSGDDYQDACEYNSWLEAKIRQHPEQYLWMHRRFKTRPEGEEKFY